MIALFSMIALAASPDSGLYKVKATLVSAQVQVGQPAKLQVKFDVASNAHISDEAPLTIKLSGDALSFEKPVLHYGDAVKPAGPAPQFEENVTASAAGTHTLDVDMTFYVCTAELCNRATEHQKLTIAAK